MDYLNACPTFLKHAYRPVQPANVQPAVLIQKGPLPIQTGMRKSFSELPYLKELRLHGNLSSRVDETEVSVLFYPE
jgi:hypothetical protein